MVQHVQLETRAFRARFESFLQLAAEDYALLVRAAPDDEVNAARQAIELAAVVLGPELLVKTYSVSEHDGQ